LCQYLKKMTQELMIFLTIGLLACVALFYGINTFFSKQNHGNKLENGGNITLPLVIQAHERITLFLERIKPENLFTRILPECSSGIETQKKAINEIRTELNHNIAQQIYIKPATWAKIELATQVLISDIIGAAANSDAKTFVINTLSNESMASKDLLKEALLQIKLDIQEKF
jgi:hypothetical protein